MLVLATMLWSAPSFASSDSEDILTMERESLNAWMHGDSSKALNSLDQEITYFHAVTDGRLEGAPAVKSLFDQYGGRPIFDRYEMLKPKVQLNGNTAVLTYCLVQHVGAVSTRWNATQVYAKKKGGWRVIHSHFSQTRPAPQTSSTSAP
jgi:hypothetical protein